MPRTARLPAAKAMQKMIPEINEIERLAQEAKRYADLKTDELKLRAVRGLSTALSRLLSFLLIFVVLSLVLGLLAFALLQWLNVLLGVPWGTLLVLLVFVVALAVLIAQRGKLFSSAFVKLFMDAFYDKDE